jgi:hypothetical protein
MKSAAKQGKGVRTARVGVDCERGVIRNKLFTPVIAEASTCGGAPGR